jgi:hypothetical protein
MDREWGSVSPVEGEAARRVVGGDAELALAVRAEPGRLFEFVPDATSDLARALGIRAGTPSGGLVVPLDLLECSDGAVAVNMIIVGTDPARQRWCTRAIDLGLDSPATAAVIALGQFHRGADLVPRGHPGDGRAELHVYRVPAGARAAMRRRLATGSHLPHPGIEQRSVRRVELRAERPLAALVDGRPHQFTGAVTVTVRPAAYRLVV